MERSLPRPRAWMFAPMAGAALAAAAWRARQRTRENDERPADVGFMVAMHDAIRRDLDRLEAVAPSLEGASRVPDGIQKGWIGFRDALLNHHTAEDDDLWPVLCSHLDRSEDRVEVDAMVTEHAAIPRALDSVATALARCQGIETRARELAQLVRKHLDHEERSVLPLLERHLTRKEWRHFLITERGRRSFRERTDFLGWVLDGANDADRAAVMGELPRPAHAVYRLVLRPRYAAQHRWQAA